MCLSRQRPSAVWEKVIRKLSADQMPPPGRPAPDKPHKDALVSWLVTEIDRDATAHPNPGRTESVHRLNRAEYHNAVRDLLALDLDVSELLPADDMSYGFDNMAGVLRITPSLLDRYVAAARKISRGAIGDPAIAPTAQTFRLKADLSQDVGFEGLPLGTRGGVSIPYQFPLDAEYTVQRRAARRRSRCSPAGSRDRRRAGSRVRTERAQRTGRRARDTTRRVMRSKFACPSRPARTSSLSPL